MEKMPLPSIEEIAKAVTRIFPECEWEDAVSTAKLILQSKRLRHVWETEEYLVEQARKIKPATTVNEMWQLRLTNASNAQQFRLGLVLTPRTQRTPKRSPLAKYGKIANPQQDS